MLWNVLDPTFPTMWADLIFSTSTIVEVVYLETGLEGELELGALDDDVGEVEEMDLERVEHSLARHDDLFGLLLHRQRSDQRSHLLSSLPLR